ncbi:hypothetical protein B0H17DRAFT_1215032 [Mycena rosella]|uniref:Uncharacterized protein n=1 Tax=Mycena rosella TaxID=1033263 RepID=A0AAD7CMB5_MYCRO|nr:hypothetical protein B0H17DRAFT_1215032 [Mycena rosella]
MCDSGTISTLQASVLLGALSVLPGNSVRYIGLGLASASLGVYAAYYYSPSQKLARLEDAITVAENVLARARLDCTRNQVELMDRASCILETKLSASKIRTQILEGRDSTWGNYSHAIGGIIRRIDMCAKDIKEIQSATMLTIETERQRKLCEGIKESKEVLNMIVCAPTRRTHLQSRRSALAVINLSHGSYM